MTENVTYGLSERTEVVRPLSTLLVQELEYPREKRERKTSERLELDDENKGK